MLPRISFVALIFLLSANGYAGDLFDVLKRMSDADQNQNYQGVFILRESDSLDTMRVAHGVNEEGIWESLESLNGEPRKVVRKNNRVISVFPDRGIITIRHNDKKQSLHQPIPDNIDKLDSYYTMERLDDDRIANHKTLVVDLAPKDQYRYGYRYWVDKNTGMLLRCDLISDTTDDNDNIVEQMMFTSLEYLPASPDEAFELADVSDYQQKVVDEPVITATADMIKSWKVARLPEGFMLTQSSMRHTHAADEQTARVQSGNQPELLHMVYSDGLASVSVFIEKYQGPDHHMRGASSMGALNAYGNEVDDYFVTVVGEVPGKTVQLIAKSTVKSN